MTDFLWKKGSEPDLNPRAMRFLAGRDVILDREILPFDIRATKAHAAGLERIGILEPEDAEAIRSSLDELAAAVRAGEFTLDERYEDSHSAIETWLTDRVGERGKRIHAGRSRNDQIAVAMRLYLRDRLDLLSDVCTRIARTCLESAESQVNVPMPGHTHLQRAMPSSLGLWSAGHAESFLDTAELAYVVRTWLNASPLGTASGFGVNLPLDREGVAEELGFRRLVLNPQCAQNSRGKAELRALDVLGAATGDLRRLAWDLSLYASQEFGYVRVGEEFCTGSSIMPNKTNPDTVELLRSVHSTVVGARTELDAMLALPSGYHRDLQGTKGPVLNAFGVALEGLDLVPDLLRSLRWDEERLRSGVTGDLHATDRANERVAGGESFRAAYRAVADNLDELTGLEPEESLAARVSTGAAGNLCLDRLWERLHELGRGGGLE